MISHRANVKLRDGSLLLYPEPSNLSAALSHNDEIFKNISFKISGIPASEFRLETRRELLTLAKEYTCPLLKGQLGRFDRKVDRDSTIVETGHQPGFFHPGVAVKYSLLDILSREFGGMGVNLAVDNDTAESTGLNIPSPLASETSNTIDLLPGAGTRPLEYLYSPSREELVTFLSAIEEGLTPPIFAHTLQNFLYWKESILASPLDNLSSATDFFILARRLFFKKSESNSLDLPVSTLAHSDMFFRFFLHLAENGEEFCNTYNSELSRYRTEHRVRYPANPFPDLRTEGGGMELPFWFFEGARRSPLFLKTLRGKKVLFSGGNEISPLPEDHNRTGFHSIFKEHIRPKAIPLTLFNRLLFSDIFIHGTGGSKYDAVTDGIIKRFFDTPPPIYITASLTKYPDIPVISKSGKIEKIEKRIRDIKFNPDRYIDESDKDIRRKGLLLDSIKEPGADRKAIGIEIKSINEKLLPRLEPIKLRLAAELLKLKEDERVYEAMARRDFPFLLFDPKEIESSLKHLF